MMNPMVIMQMLVKSNPNLREAYNRATQMAQGKGPEDLRKIAANLCEQRGMNLDQTMAEFQRRFGNL